jgi:hypothetical protein
MYYIWHKIALTEEHKTPILARYNVIKMTHLNIEFYASSRIYVMFAVVMVSDYNLSKPRMIQGQASRTEEQDS